MTNSDDPRINRLNPFGTKDYHEKKLQDEWETYEVFHQRKRGEQHVHTGIVHAPNRELALVFAKEQYGRRRITSNLWVVKSSEIFASSYDDADIFRTTPEKTYREASDYYCLDRVRKYQKEHGIKDRKEMKRKKKDD
jgi:ring-1,2-phenylacetyl-CoA epoxidase subunit PaaB